MINPVRFAAMACFLINANLVLAGTVVQIQNHNDLITVSTDGSFARMDMSADEYVIVDYSKQTVRIVNPSQKQVMLLNVDTGSDKKTGSELRTAVKKTGAGMTVAGYATQKYAYSANGKSCGMVYGSMDAYQQQGMKKLLLAMKNMMDKQRAILGGFASMMDDCMRADMQIGNHVNTIGVPMRTEKNGVVNSEVKSIKLGVNLPADTFVIPASYKTVSMQQQMREVKQQVQQYQPQIQQMMQQMQGAGQMSPEMIEQMRRAQQLMKQYQ